MITDHGMIYRWDNPNLMSHQILMMMMTEMVLEMLLVFNEMTWLIAQEDFTDLHKDRYIYYICSGMMELHLVAYYNYQSTISVHRIQELFLMVKLKDRTVTPIYLYLCTQ
jgi:hypothetical protein